MPFPAAQVQNRPRWAAPELGQRPGIPAEPGAGAPHGAGAEGGGAARPEGGGCGPGQALGQDPVAHRRLIRSTRWEEVIRGD